MTRNNQTRYELVIAVSKRARNISEKAIDRGIVLEDKPVIMAMEDIEDGKVIYGEGIK